MKVIAVQGSATQPEATLAPVGAPSSSRAAQPLPEARRAFRKLQSIHPGPMVPCAIHPFLTISVTCCRLAALPSLLSKRLAVCRFA